MGKINVFLKNKHAFSPRDFLDNEIAQKSSSFSINLPYLNPIMLPPSHNRAYQDFLTLLTELDSFLVDQGEKNVQSQVKLRFQDLTAWFEQNIKDLSQEDLDREVVPRWQSLQTEIKREFKLLLTDMLFLSSARQNSTQIKRINSIGDRLTKLIGYCQIMLNKSN